MFKRILYLVTLILFFVSCDKKSTINNSEEDIKRGQELASKFYKELSENDTLKINNYLDKSISSADFGKLVKNNLKNYGVIQKVDIKKTETSNITFNENIEINYILEIYVEYEKSKNIEKISFVKKNDEPIKLDGYLTQEIIE